MGHPRIQSAHDLVGGWHISHVDSLIWYEYVARAGPASTDLRPEPPCQIAWGVVVNSSPICYAFASVWNVLGDNLESRKPSLLGSVEDTSMKSGRLAWR